MALVMAPPRSAPCVVLRRPLIAAISVACVPTPPSPPSTRARGAWERRADAPVALTEVAVGGARRPDLGGGRAHGRWSGSTKCSSTTRRRMPGPRDPNLPEPVHHSTLVSDGEVAAARRRLGGQRFRHADDGGVAASTRRRRHGSTTRRFPSRARPGRQPGTVADRLRGRGRAGRRVGRGVRVRGRRWSQVARLANPREHLAVTSDGEGASYVLGGRVCGLDGNLATADLVAGGTARDDRRAADPARRRRGVLVADPRRLPRRRGVTRRHEPAGRVHRRRRQHLGAARSRAATPWAGCRGRRWGGLRRARWRPARAVRQPDARGAGAAYERSGGRIVAPSRCPTGGASANR